MIAVRVTVTKGTRTVSVDELADARLASALQKAGQDVARKLDGIVCPVHRTKAKNVRVHFDEHGRADLQYESCCAKLGRCVGEVLG